MIVDRLREAQAYGQQHSAELGIDPAGIPGQVQTLALDLLPAFGPGMVILADRNFLSHTLARPGSRPGVRRLRAPASGR
jgi:hypothetical protein